MAEPTRDEIELHRFEDDGGKPPPICEACKGTRVVLRGWFIEPCPECEPKAARQGH